MRIDLTLRCDDCKRENYRTSRSRENTDKLELKKYCSACRTHTVHKETKK